MRPRGRKGEVLKGVIDYLLNLNKGGKPADASAALAR
jgi:hypothetical protein